MEDATLVTLTSAPDQEGKCTDVQLDIELVRKCVTLRNLLDDATDTSARIPLPNVTPPTLALVVDYLQKRFAPANTTNASGETSDATDNNKVEDTYCNEMDDETLFALTMAANYLEQTSLLDSGCKKIAHEIKQCKTPEDIRKRFNIENDFTPEEEEEVRRENAWLDIEAPGDD